MTAEKNNLFTTVAMDEARTSTSQCEKINLSLFSPELLRRQKIVGTMLTLSY